MTRKTLLAALLLLSLPSAYADQVLNLTGYFCTTVPPSSAIETAQWKDATCSQSSTKSNGGAATGNCTGDYIETDTSLPHGLCHLVQVWAPESFVTANAACTQLTSQTFYVYSSYNY